MPLLTFLFAYHGFDTADDLEGVVHAVASHSNQHFVNGLLVIFRVDAVSGSQLLGLGKLVTIDIDGDDARSSSRLAAHDNREANSSEAEDSTGRACFHLW